MTPRLPLRRAARIAILLAASSVAPLVGVARAGDPPKPSGLPAAFESITPTELDLDLRYLASPELEGRDTPSVGLALAAERIVQRFASAGLLPALDSADVWQSITGKPLEGASTSTGGASGDATKPTGTFLRPWTRNLPTPDAASKLVLLGASPRDFRLGVDFAPVAGLAGDAEGELAFAGFGIDSRSERYSDLDGLKLKGAIALIVAGEPDHPKAFDGPEISDAAALWSKVDAVAKSGAAAILVARRPPAVAKAKDKKKEGEPAAEPARFSFRSTWADWVGARHDPEPKEKLPVLEVSLDCATALLGEDVQALAARIERAMKPVRVKTTGKRVKVASRTKEESVPIDNVVGFVRGTDLADEHVVVGAHYDHVGVDDRGRIGFGADDNASGTAALMELAQAISIAAPRRTVWFCAFSGEEDGLLGSKALAKRLPVDKAKIVAMVNLDMIGRGDASEVAVLGVNQTPWFEKLLSRAKALKPSGVTKLVLRQGEELFQRSDHYSFHEIGVPSLFFFEGLPIDKNKDYHTWRDTADKIDGDKVLHTTRLVFNTVWLLSTEDERPPRPRE